MNMRSLHIKVSLSVAAAALLVVVLSSQYFYQRSYEKSFADSERSVQQLLETLRATAAIAAYVGNRELAQQVVDGLTLNDIVTGARIHAGNDLLAEQGKAALAAQLGISQPLYGPFDEQEVVGRLEVIPNSALIELRARDSAMATALGLAAQAAVVALLVLILVYLMMTRPLVHLSGRLHRITPGDGERIAVANHHTGDEIGLLSNDINALLRTLEAMLEEERQLRHRVEQLETRFRGIFEDSSAGIFLVRANGHLITANPAFYRLTNLSETESAGLGTTPLFNAIFRDAIDASALVQLAGHTRRPHSADLRLCDNAQGEERWVHCIFSPAGSHQSAATVEGVMYDVTERKRAEQRSRTLAETDALTGLSNRQAADDALHGMIAQRGPGTNRFAVLLIDLDRFKFINDTYGHDAGDRVLIAIAQRLRQLVRDSDLVARIGGDEFLVLLNHAGNIQMVQRIAQKILDAQREPIEVQPGILECLGMSIGIALHPEHGDNPMSLRKHADQAMYYVKRQGKNAYALYEPSLHNSTPAPACTATGSEPLS